MAIHKSPGVITREEDVTENIQPVGTIAAAIVSESQRGRIDEPSLITGTQQAIDRLGKPNAELYGFGGYTALAALETTPSVYFLRVPGNAKFSAISFQSLDDNLTEVSNDGFVTEVFEAENVAVNTPVSFNTNLRAGDTYQVMTNLSSAVIEIEDDLATKTVSNYTLVFTPTSVEFTNTSGATNPTVSIRIRHKVAGKDNDDINEKIAYLQTSNAVVESLIITAENPGQWGDTVGVSISELNTVDNTFELTTFLQQGSIKVPRNEYICTLGQQQDDDGNQLYVQDLINESDPDINAYSLQPSGLPVGSNTVATAATGSGRARAGTVSVGTSKVRNILSAGGIDFTRNRLAEQVPNADSGRVSIAGPGVSVSIHPVSGEFTLDFDAAPSGNVILVVELDTPLTLSADNLVDGEDATERASVSDINAAWAVFRNDQYAVNMLLNAGYTDYSTHNAMTAVADTRRDCVAILDAPRDMLDMSPVQSLTNWKASLPVSSSYAMLDAPWLTVNDTYNRIRRLDMPPSGFRAQVIARTHRDLAVWEAPAGKEVGNIFSTGLPFLKLTHNYNMPERDLLYSMGINYFQTFPGQGTFAYGQKTLLSGNKSTNRVNVRYLAILIKQSVELFLDGILFKLNDSITRQRVRTQISAFLRDIQDRRGIYAYVVQCDESNNTPQVIDNNELRVNIRVEPTRTVEFITFTLTLTATGESNQVEEG